MTETCPITALKNILVATDGSACSEKALHEAINLAKTCNTKLQIITVIEVNDEFEALAPQLVEKMEEETKMFLDAAKKCAERENVTCTTIVHQGEDVAHFILEEADRINADMIVMGRHGKKKGIKRLLIGSITAKVISHTQHKILIVPN